MYGLVATRLQIELGGLGIFQARLFIGIFNSVTYAIEEAAVHVVIETNGVHSGDCRKVELTSCGQCTNRQHQHRQPNNLNRNQKSD